MDDPRSIAVDVQTRFQFYVLGLTFGVLALSVQTAAFDARPIVASVAELSAWLLLLTSGLFGLSHLEWVPQAYVVNAVEGDVQERTRSLKKAALQGASSIHVLGENRQRSVEELLARADDDMKVVTARHAELKRWSQFKYTAQKATFVGGLVALMVARGYKPVTDIIDALTR